MGAIAALIFSYPGHANFSQYAAANRSIYAAFKLSSNGRIWATC